MWILLTSAIYIYLIYLFIRNQRVKIFMNEITIIIHDTIENMINKHYKEHEDISIYSNAELDYRLKQLHKLAKKYNHKRLLFSFKRLHLNRWYSEEEIIMMFGYSTYMKIDYLKSKKNE